MDVTDVIVETYPIQHANLKPDVPYESRRDVELLGNNESYETMHPTQLWL